MSPRDQANLATVHQASEIIGCNKNTLRRAVKQGTVPVAGHGKGRRMHRVLLVDLSDVDAWREAIKKRPRYIDSCGDRLDEEIARMRGVKVASVRRARERRKRRQA